MLHLWYMVTRKPWKLLMCTHTYLLCIWLKLMSVQGQSITGSVCESWGSTIGSAPVRAMRGRARTYSKQRRSCYSLDLADMRAVHFWRIVVARQTYDTDTLNTKTFYSQVHATNTEDFLANKTLSTETVKGKQYNTIPVFRWRIVSINILIISKCFYILKNTSRWDPELELWNTVDTIFLLW